MENTNDVFPSSIKAMVFEIFAKKPDFPNDGQTIQTTSKFHQKYLNFLLEISTYCPEI